MPTFNFSVTSSTRLMSSRPYESSSCALPTTGKMGVYAPRNLSNSGHWLSKLFGDTKYWRYSSSSFFLLSVTFFVLRPGNAPTFVAWDSDGTKGPLSRWLVELAPPRADVTLPTIEEATPANFVPVFPEDSVWATWPLMCLWNTEKSLNERSTVHSSRKYLALVLPFFSTNVSALSPARSSSSSTPMYSAIAVQRILYRMIEGDRRSNSEGALASTVPMILVFNPRNIVGYLGFNNPFRLSCPLSMWFIPRRRSRSNTDCCS
mmetsp:Transcript_975/g.1615  ORF Transcript_975/g.1615 Transcript_975/m.1615 type:complete len:262 (-) Transcript_975:2347-3132(-)